MELDAGGGIVGQRLRLQRGVHGQMIFRVFAVQIGKVELLHEADQLRAREVAEGIAGQAEVDGRGLAGLWNGISQMRE